MRTVGRSFAPGLTLVAALLIGWSVSAAADDWPPLRQGLWEITRTMQAPGGGAPRVVTGKRCLDPAADWKAQNARLAKAGCSFTPLQRSGNQYSFSSTCAVMGVMSSGRTTITANGDSAYSMTVESVTDGQKTSETATGRRVGDCVK